MAGSTDMRMGGVATMAREMRRRKRVEARLRESEERLRAIFESTEEAIITFDSEQRCLEANRAAGVITGVPHDQLTGRFLLEFIDPSFDLASEWGNFLRSGRFRGEVRIRHLNGSFRLVEALGTAHIGPDRHLFVGRDITEHKRAEESLRESEASFRSLFENMTEGVVLHKLIYDEGGTATDYRILTANPAFEKHTGLAREKCRGQLASVFYGTGRAPYLDEYARVADSGEPFSFETYFPPLGRHFRISVSSPKKEHFVTVFEDITERKRMEEDLRRSRDELELTVQQRTADLKKANAKLTRSNRQLEALNKELQDFAFVASHDLQEPLRKVHAFGSMVVDKCGASLDETSRDYIERMQAAAARMKDLLVSLLAYSRVTTKVEPIEETDLRESVEEALSNLEIAIKEKHARVEIGVLPTVKADRVQMVQLFQNLVGNALKFQPDDQAPCVRIYSREATDREGAYEICVEDNGIGFEEKHLDKIFLPLQRLRGRSSGFEGTGMGLAICKKIVERHDGEITARSELGKGSTFIVTLPAGKETHEARSEEYADPLLSPRP